MGRTGATVQHKIQVEVLNEGFKGCGSPLCLANMIRVNKEFQMLLIGLLIKLTRKVQLNP